MSVYEQLRPRGATAVAAVGCALAAAAWVPAAGGASLLHFRVGLGRAERATAPRRSLPAACARFRTVDVPGAAATLVTGANNSGTLVGFWSNSQGGSFGFIEHRGGPPTTFNFPGTTGVTLPSSINDRGVTVGAFFDTNNVPHGWVRSPRGHFTQLDDPAAMGAGTVAFGINDPGVIVGFYVDPANASVTHGFVYDHGTFRTLDYPGAASTQLSALNSAGAIVGTYTDASGVSHGFLYKHGKFTPINAPGAGTSSGQGTFAVGISSNGLIDGQMTNKSGGFGWLLRNGQFSSLNDPNTAPGQDSFPEGISSNGRYIPGFYNDASGASHGYLATLRKRCDSRVRRHP